VTDALHQVPQVSGVQVNLADDTVQLSLTDATPFRDVFQTLNRAGYPPVTQTTRFEIGGMTCASCLGRVQRVLDDKPGVVEANVNLADDAAQVTFLPHVITAQALAKALTDAGYPSQAVTDHAADQETDHRGAEVLRHQNAVIWAAVLTLPVFIIEMGGHVFPQWHHLIMRTIGQTGSWLAQFALTTVVLLGPGRAFFTRGATAARHFAPDMNTLVALGAGAAWLYSTIALFLPGVMPPGSAVVYFEAAAVIVTLILLGRWLEARAKGQTGEAIQQLIGLQPQTAWRQAGADWEEIPIDALALDDVILIRPGARVPTDAIAVSGQSPVDESMITGEPIPVIKSAGDTLTGGTVNGAGTLTARVLHIGADTTLSRIIHMVRQAQATRLPVQALVDRITLWFMPAVLGVATLTFLSWLFFAPQPALPSALVAGVSVLIIACPCAMGLATPTSIMVGIGSAARKGVLFRQGDALQSLSAMGAIAFDKTGTLTKGTPEVTTFKVAEGYDAPKLLARIASVEALSEHPLAHAVVQAAQAQDLALGTPETFRVLPGQGVQADLDGASVAVGNSDLMAALGVDLSAMKHDSDTLAEAGNGVFFAAVDGHLAALIGVSDPIREDTADAIKRLRQEGLAVAMITGDNTRTATAVARAVGIEHVVAETRPEDKVDALKGIAAAYDKVAFVGDGINDAPVLAQADVGIAVGTGTDVAIETADVVLMSGALSGVVRAFDTSRRTLRNIRQNLFWAFGYNVLLIPLAAGVLYPAYGLLLSPALAAGAMALSSVFVVLNALRLRRLL
jgi:Cu+-exporting ATPase